MQVPQDPTKPIAFRRNPATYRMSLWMAPLIVALAYFAWLESIAWLTAFNLLIAGLMLLNYSVLRATPVLRFDGAHLLFRRKLWERHRRPIAGLEALDESDRRFTLHWRDGTVLAVSKQHFLDVDLPRVAAWLENASATGRLGTDL